MLNITEGMDKNLITDKKLWKIFHLHGRFNNSLEFTCIVYICDNY